MATDVSTPVVSTEPSLSDLQAARKALQDAHDDFEKHYLVESDLRQSSDGVAFLDDPKYQACRTACAKAGKDIIDSRSALVDLLTQCPTDPHDPRRIYMAEQSNGDREIMNIIHRAEAQRTQMVAMHGQLTQACAQQ